MEYEVREVQPPQGVIPDDVCVVCLLGREQGPMFQGDFDHGEKKRSFLAHRAQPCETVALTVAILRADLLVLQADYQKLVLRREEERVEMAGIKETMHHQRDLLKLASRFEMGDGAVIELVTPPNDDKNATWKIMDCTLVLVHGERRFGSYEGLSWMEAPERGHERNTEWERMRYPDIFDAARALAEYRIKNTDRR